MLRVTVAVVIGALAVSAQDFGTLRGILVDPRGALIVGAKVEVREIEAGVTVRAESSVRGFEFNGLATGTYEVIVWPMPRFHSRKIQGVELRADAVRDLGRVVIEFDDTSASIPFTWDPTPMQVPGRPSLTPVPVEIPLCSRFPNGLVMVFDASRIHLRVAEMEHSQPSKVQEQPRTP
jgi:hypothetical protein